MQTMTACGTPIPADPALQEAQQAVAKLLEYPPAENVTDVTVLAQGYDMLRNGVQVVATLLEVPIPKPVVAKKKRAKKGG